MDNDEELAEAVYAEEQDFQDREESAWKDLEYDEDWVRIFGSPPDESMRQERHEADVEAGLVDPPSDPLTSMVQEVMERYDAAELEDTTKKPD
ncbi:hypothetical protein [Halomonas tibetensis]|uniref:Uncharacterized protein n=1 Tax=Halomonas tibetensis TaxID=2259590 RepID=A0ABV7BAH9_9GAMM